MASAISEAPPGAGSVAEALLRLGDDALILGQRLCQWCGRAPVLEEDIALANVALDLLGQARQWLALAAQREGRGRDEDALAFLRDAQAWRNVLLVEQPNGNFADTMARQFLFDSWHHLRLEGLQASPDAAVAASAARALKEVAYHVRHSADWVIRLGDGTDRSHGLMQAAMDDLWTYTGELFDLDEVDRAVSPSADAVALRSAWLDHVETVLREATLTVPASFPLTLRGRHGVHSEHMGYILAEMQFLQRAYPGCQW